jgi:excisionase family DNA binding protein
VTVAIPAELLEAIADRVAEIILARQTGGPGRRLIVGREFGGVGAGPYLTVAEAAEYPRSKKQRVYDLVSARRLTRFKDGRRVLVSRAELDEYLAMGGSTSRVAPALPQTPRNRMGSGLAG